MDGDKLKVWTHYRRLVTDPKSATLPGRIDRAFLYMPDVQLGLPRLIFFKNLLNLVMLKLISFKVMHRALVRACTSTNMNLSTNNMLF